MSCGGAQHDVQLDYYGKRLASCSSDKTVKIFDVTCDEPTLSYTLAGCAAACAVAAAAAAAADQRVCV